MLFILHTIHTLISQTRLMAASGFAIGVTALGMLFPATIMAERSVTLAWERSSDPAAVGYYVYSLEENASTPTRYNVAGLTQVTVPSLKEGLRYTFKVTAYSAAGLESAPSNEAAFVVPVPLELLPGTTVADAKRLRFPMAPGHWYELQASTNLTTWVTIWQTGTASTYAWTEYLDTKSAIPVKNSPLNVYLPSRYYRLKVH